MLSAFAILVALALLCRNLKQWSVLWNYSRKQHKVKMPSLKQNLECESARPSISPFLQSNFRIASNCKQSMRMCGEFEASQELIQSQCSRSQHCYCSREVPEGGEAWKESHLCNSLEWLPPWTDCFWTGLGQGCHILQDVWRHEGHMREASSSVEEDRSQWEMHRSCVLSDNMASLLSPCERSLGRTASAVLINKKLLCERAL